MNDRSIYNPHYEGETYSFAVAYLVEHDAPASVNRRQAKEFRESDLREQRTAIAFAALDDHAIIVAEIVDSEPNNPPDLRTAFEWLQRLLLERKIPICYVAERDDLVTWMTGIKHWLSALSVEVILRFPKREE